MDAEKLQPPFQLQKSWNLNCLQELLVSSSCQSSPKNVNGVEPSNSQLIKKANVVTVEKSAST